MTPRLYAMLGGALLLLGAIVAIKMHLAADERTRGKLAALTEQSANVLNAARAASDNPSLRWNGVAGQVTALGDSVRTLRLSLDTQNRAIDDMASEAVRLRAKAAELKKIADKAEAQRASALERLGDLGATPGTREDCLTLLREAEEALDIVREAGL